MILGFAALAVVGVLTARSMNTLGLYQYQDLDNVLAH